MEQDIIIESFLGKLPLIPYSLREIIFNKLSHRSEMAAVMLGHIEEKLIEINLPELRALIDELRIIVNEKNLVKGDTVLLASYYSSNEFSNAILFAAFACIGIRIFIPIYPEVNEFESWRELTKFKAVIIPYKEILREKGHEKEKESVNALASLCAQHDIPYLDSYEDFFISGLLGKIKSENWRPLKSYFFSDELSPETEAVIFTTSGTSGKSKLVVYNQGAFSISCQSWQLAGLFAPGLFGNKGLTPLFTHTIGIRSFINAIWTGHPVCILVVDWFLHKPEVARYLLLQMRPQHIVGGPALFNMLLEFFRQYPELKMILANDLKAFISIGAPFNVDTARQIETTMGLPLFNGMGTTETQMVLLNRLENGDTESLGLPLPGVSIKLKKTETGGLYELFVYSPYESSYVIGEPNGDAYLSTGDFVRCDERRILTYAYRKEDDFIKDGFGVKIPINSLRDYYPLLYKISTHIEWIPLDKYPGLAAIIFLDPSGSDYSAKEISEWLKIRNEKLRSRLQPFEFLHRHLERISLTKTDIPVTRKGTLSKKDILYQYGELMASLKNPYLTDNRIESVDAEEKSLQHRFSNPRLALLLETLGMDVHFERGERDTLYYKSRGKEKSVLDLVGGFGANLLGHAHPEVRAAIKNFLESDRPAINSQGSSYYYPALLARELNLLFNQATGKCFKVQFGNTGAEAVEIALHHAYYAWWTKLQKFRDEQLQRYGSLEGFDVSAIWDQNMKAAMEAPAAVMVMNNCFHGYSSGTRTLLNGKKQRILFSGLLRAVPLHVNDKSGNWREQIELLKADHCIKFNFLEKENEDYVVKEISVSNIIASIIEPVRGEGGIYETNTGLADLLSQQSFPLISDEIQCGLGRTGTIPSYSGASYYLLGKSLGGGYEKISAVLIDDEKFISSFPQYYHSTFANGEMAACAGLAAVQVIIKEKYADIARVKGMDFLHKIQQVAERYPDIIESVEGKGLMIGIHFENKLGRKNILLRALCENELLGYLLAGWFFHNDNIRVLPSLSKPDSLRLEPSVYITEENMDRFCDALEKVSGLCRYGNLYELFLFLMNGDPYLDKAGLDLEGKFPVGIEKPLPGALKVGFIGNFTMPPKELMLIEPYLQRASYTGLRILFEKMQVLLDGKCVRLFSRNLMNGKINFTFYILPYDTAHLEIVHHFGRKRNYIAKIQDAINQLAQSGVTHVGLGAHSSILTGNGLCLAESGDLKILTGNTLTIASCLYHTSQYFKEIRRKGGLPITIAIVGAGGNIGSALTGCLDDENFHGVHLILVGNSSIKLEHLKKKVSTPGRHVTITSDLFLLKDADIIIGCTSSNDPIIFSHHVSSEKKVFIIDIAVPGSVSDKVKQQHNVKLCNEASSVYLPEDPDFLISTHTPVGKIFCCAAEVILAALFDVRFLLKGHVQPESIKAMMELAGREGFLNRRAYATSV